MKIIEENNFNEIFPMNIKCEQIVDEYGFTYGEEKDFCGSLLEIDPSDIKKHKWFKYPNYEGVDYGVICPVCKQFIMIDSKKIPKHILISSEEIYLSDL